MAAGLGGGSSDAAAALRALRALVAGDDHSRLRAIATALGADVPFFLQGGTALGVGRGDVICPLAGRAASVGRARAAAVWREHRRRVSLVGRESSAGRRWIASQGQKDGRRDERSGGAGCCPPPGDRADRRRPFGRRVPRRGDVGQRIGGLWNLQRGESCFSGAASNARHLAAGRSSRARCRARNFARSVVSGAKHGRHWGFATCPRKSPSYTLTRLRYVVRPLLRSASPICQSTESVGRGQAVRRGTLDPVFEGSNPSAPANS